MRVLAVLRTAVLIAAAFVVIVVLLSLMEWPVPSHPLVILVVLLPIGLLVLGMALMPVRMSPVVRLVTSVVVFAIYLLLRHMLTPRNWWTQMNTRDVAVGAPFEVLGTVSLVIALVWLAGQMVLVVLSDRVRSGSGNAMAASLVDRGYMGILLACARGEFGLACARWATGLRWGAFILVGVFLLFRSGSLHRAEEDILLPLGGVGETSGPSRSVLVSLMTGDNNPREYLRTAIEINALFRRGGAVVVCIPRTGARDSTTLLLVDSLEAAGAVVFDRDQFATTSIGGRHSQQYLRFWAAGYGWSNTLPLIHPSILAAARYLHVPVQLPPDYKRMPGIPWTGIIGSEGATPTGGDILLGTVPVPRWSDGWSVVPRPRGLLPSQRSGGDTTYHRTLWDSFIFRVSIMRSQWHEPIQYSYYGDGRVMQTIPDSVLQLVAGRMVFLDWMDMGEGHLRGFAAGPAMIADMLTRGVFIREAPAWHALVSMVVILLGIALFVWSRTSVILILLLSLAVVIGAADVWLFKEYLLVTRLIYPAFVALVAAVVFPLVRIAERG